MPGSRGVVMIKSVFLNLAAALSLTLGAPALAQITQIDPNDAGEYEPPAYPAQPTPTEAPSADWNAPAPTEEYYPIDPGPQQAQPAPDAPATARQQPAAPADARASAAVSGTVSQDNVLSAAEGVFGRGAEGLAGLIEDILRKQGEPSAYITGEEAGGAVVFGLRYGKGMLHHQAGGDKKVYWTGPSVGFDFGGQASKVFVLVYNLHDTEDLFTRFGSAEGSAYVVGGMTASYLRKGDLVLIPIRTGLGVKLGVNAGYMKFTEKGTWIPF